MKDDLRESDPHSGPPTLEHILFGWLDFMNQLSFAHGARWWSQSDLAKDLTPSGRCGRLFLSDI